LTPWTWGSPLSTKGSSDHPKPAAQLGFTGPGGLVSFQAVLYLWLPGFFSQIQF
jgi:hypothetical protein